MQSSSLITIITPTYNRGYLLKRAINSVLTQTYPNWEYIIVDDASTDNTEDVVSEYKDPRIIYLKYIKNGGNAVARNVGLNAAKGDYIAFLDSDDEFLPTYLEKAIKTIRQDQKASFLWSGTRTIAIDKTFIDRIWVPVQESHPNQFLYELHVGIGRGFLIGKECFNDLKFDERLRTAVDTDFLIRLRQKFNFTVLEEILLYIHTQPGSVRTNYTEKKKSYNIIINKNYEIIQANDFLNFKWYYKLFWLSLYDNDMTLANRAYERIKQNGFKPKFLKMIFKIFPTHIAIKIHKKLSN